jgi:hypothetical protein
VVVLRWPGRGGLGILKDFQGAKRMVKELIMEMRYMEN